jgi:hypothetical protein
VHTMKRGCTLKGEETLSLEATHIEKGRNLIGFGSHL